MAGIQLTGLASGMDTSAIVSQLMAVERQPRTAMQYNQSFTQARRNNLADLQGKLSSLKLAAHDLGSVVSWADTQSVDSSDSTKVSAKLTGGAGPGAYEIAVNSLATSARSTYDFSSASATTLAIKDSNNNQVGSFDIAAGSSLDDLVANINATPAAGVYAVNVNDKLVLSSRTTGAQSNFSVTGLAPSDPGLYPPVTGADASFTVNNTGYTSSSNVVTDIPGLQLTLKAKTTSTTVTVGNPGPDLDQVKTKIKSFVDAYNTALTAMNTDLAEKRVVSPANATDAAKGSLFGDGGVRDMLDAIRTAVGSPIDGFTTTPNDTTASGINTLAQLGISTGAANTGTTINQDAVSGKLTFDESTFDAAVAKDPLGVQKLLGGMIGSDGFAQKFENTVGTYSNTGGILSQRLTSVDGDLSDIADSLSRFDDRLASRQTYYEQQFQAMEAALAKSQSLAAQMQSQLSSLMG
jgi:flagellar hook-associated protein 2